jgi:Sec-independent protein translocase protein TatA
LLHYSLSPLQLLIILVIVLLIFGTRHLRGLGEHADQLARELSDSVHRRMPVFSAETTRGKEAEFIRDRLPKRFPTALFVAALVLFAAAAWWLTR